MIQDMLIGRQTGFEPVGVGSSPAPVIIRPHSSVGRAIVL